MVKIFISYSRVDTDFVKSFIDNLSRKYRHENIWYDDKIIGGHQWWNEILEKIAWCHIFIYLLSNESVNSEYCQAEFEEAQRLRKHIITVQVRDRTKLDATLSEIQYIDMIPGADLAVAYTRLYAAIDNHIIPKRTPRPRWKPATPRPGTTADETQREGDNDVTTPTLKPSERAQLEESPSTATKPQERKLIKLIKRFSWLLLSIIGLVAIGRAIASWSGRLTDAQGTVVAAIIGAIAVIFAAAVPGIIDSSRISSTSTVAVPLTTEAPSHTPTVVTTEVPSPTPIVNASDTVAPTVNPTATMCAGSSLSAFSILQTQAVVTRTPPAMLTLDAIQRATPTIPPPILTVQAQQAATAMARTPSLLLTREAVQQATHDAESNNCAD